jgi:putative oxidoreductase
MATTTNKYVTNNFFMDLDLQSRIDASAWSRYIVPIGRTLFALIFIFSSFAHFSRMTIDYAADQGVPWAGLVVPVSGLLALLGGLSVLFGYRARLGAVFLILFLIPVTLIMHNFWDLTDPAAIMVQRTMFLKNLSMLGGALLIFYFGSGPLSLDQRRVP